MAKDDVGGKRFGGYEIIEHLGTHDGTRVYQAKQLNLGRTVRLSVLPAAAAKKPAFLVAFKRERAVVSELRHDNVLAAIDAGEIDGNAFVVMEDVAGRRLADAFEQERVFGVAEALRIARDVAAALHHFERHGYVHRFVTPQAIVLAESGVSKLAGFSRTKQSETGADETWFEVEEECAAYRPPETTRGKGRYDVRGDIYAVGCILYQLLTGRPPFVGTNAAVVMAAHTQEEVKPPRSVRPDIPVSAELVTLNCLQKSRADRYQHAAELVRDLDAAIAGNDVATLGAPPPRRRRSAFRNALRRRRF